MGDSEKGTGAKRLAFHYDEWHAGKRLGSGLHSKKVTNILALAKVIPPPRRILDIGAGSGMILEALAHYRLGQEYHALEISSEAVELVKQRAIANLIQVQQYDGYHIPYEARTFDLAILSHVVEHVEFPRMLLYEASRVARYVFVEVPLLHHFRTPYDFRWNAEGHINFYAIKTMRALLQTSRLEIVGQKITNPSRGLYKALKDSMLLISPRLATLWLTYHYSAICRSLEEHETSALGSKVQSDIQR